MNTNTVRAPILFDFDGVILKNDKLGKYIETKAAKYVQKKLKVSETNGVNLNKILYRVYGHTVVGVSKTLEIDYKDITQEFNEFVYKDLHYHTLLNSTLSFIDTERLKYLHEGISVLKQNNLEQAYPVGLFTNAPLEWCINTMAFMGYDLNELFNEAHIYTSDTCLLKPQIDFYVHVEKQSQKHGWLPNGEHPIHFIDDSITNITPIIDNMNWKFTWLNSNNPMLLKTIIQKRMIK